MDGNRVLRDIRIKIDQVEKREAAMRPVRTLPEGPGWVVAYLRERGRRVPAAVHIGDCTLAGKNKEPVTREEARRILAGGRIRGCDICRPERELGILGWSGRRLHPAMAITRGPRLA